MGVIQAPKCILATNRAFIMQQISNTIQEYTLDMRFLADYFGNERIRPGFEILSRQDQWNRNVQERSDWGELLDCFGLWQPVDYHEE